MPIREFLADKSFDPDRLDILDEAFRGACADLGLHVAFNLVLYRFVLCRSSCFFDR